MRSFPCHLTIAIPTYNRADCLDARLAWFAGAVRGLEPDCELLVYDNASTDETPEVMARWRAVLEAQGVNARFTRRARNIGAVRNIAGCLEAARGRYVWVLGDDDAPTPDALRYVLETKRARANLALLILNFSSRYRKGGLRFARSFEIPEDVVAADGQALYAAHLENAERWGGLVLTSALVYRSGAVRAALASWPDGVDNITYQLYFTAHVAQQGAVMMSAEPKLEMAAGQHFFSDDPELYFAFRFAHVPEAFAKLAELGYDAGLCRRRILGQLRKLRRHPLARLLATRPGFTLGVLGRWGRAFVSATLPRPRPLPRPLRRQDA
jgi:abequosyltransferase